MKQPRIWILVADGACATIYRNKGQKDLRCTILETVPEGSFRRNKGARLHLGPRPGKNFANALGDARHAVSTHEQRERDAERKFIGEVIQWLDEARQKDRFDYLIVVAPPRALGEIRAALPAGTLAKLSTEIRADLVNSSVKEIEDHVRNHLNPTHTAA